VQMLLKPGPAETALVPMPVIHRSSVGGP